MPADSSRFQEPGRSVLDREELPGARDAFQLVLTSVGELQARPDDEIPDGPGHQDLARAGLRRDAGADVYGDPSDVSVSDLALAGVQARPDLDPQGPDRLPYRGRAPHR